MRSRNADGDGYCPVVEWDNAVVYTKNRQDVPNTHVAINETNAGTFPIMTVAPHEVMQRSKLQQDATPPYMP